MLSRRARRVLKQGGTSKEGRREGKGGASREGTHGGNAHRKSNINMHTFHNISLLFTLLSLFSSSSSTTSFILPVLYPSSSTAPKHSSLIPHHQHLATANTDAPLSAFLQSRRNHGASSPPVVKTKLTLVLSDARVHLFILQSIVSNMLALARSSTAFGQANSPGQHPQHRVTQQPRQV